MPGFRTFVRTGIVLQVGSNPTINVVLEVGQVTETVEVQAAAALVETRSVSVGQVMETARIMELPLNGLNAQELLLLGGGSVQTSTGSGQSFPGRLLISSAGARGTALVIGVGRLGSTITAILASSGVGRVMGKDPQAVSLDTINGSILLSEFDIGRPKVHALEMALHHRPHFIFEPVETVCRGPFERLIGA